MICRASASSSFFTSVAATGSSISSWLLHVLGEEQRLERERVPFGRIRQSFSFPASTNDPSPTTSASRHRLEQERVGRRCASVAAGTRK